MFLISKDFPNNLEAVDLEPSATRTGPQLKASMSDLLFGSGDLDATSYRHKRSANTLNSRGARRPWLQIKNQQLTSGAYSPNNANPARRLGSQT
jgi:hypothetical protein